MKRFWFSFCCLNISEPTWHFNRYTVLQDNLISHYSGRRPGIQPLQLPQNVTMMSTGWKDVPHRSSWLASSFLIRSLASQQLLWGVTFHPVNIMVASWEEWWLPGCIIVQLITSWIAWYKRCLILKENSVFHSNSQAHSRLVLLYLTFSSSV